MTPRARLFSALKNGLLPLLVACMLAGLPAALPATAFAEDLPEFDLPDDIPPDEDVRDIETCTQNSGLTEEKITSRVVFCIRAAVLVAVGTMLQDLSEYMVNTVTAAAALAVAVFGIRVLGGEAEITARTVSALLRLGLVGMFSYNLGNVPGALFGVMDWLISLVVPFPGWTPWEQIDAFLGRLMGFAPGYTLVNGVLGVVLASALSATAGSAMALSGMMAMGQLMLFILDIVYAYLTALLVLGFMIIISPLIVPLALFKYSERFFKKWLNTVIGAILMPMLLFAFLSISLNVFDALIQNVISNLSDNLTDANGNPTFEEHWRTDQPFFSWIAVADPNLVKDQQESMLAKIRSMGSAGQGREGETRVLPPIGTEINPFQRTGMDVNKAIAVGTDYDFAQLQRVFLSFIALWVFARLVMGLIRKMPEIAAAISASVLIALQPQNFKQKMDQAARNFGLGAGAMAGGWAGSQLGGLAGARMRSVGAIGGIAAGGALGERFAGSLGEKFGAALNGQMNGQQTGLKDVTTPLNDQISKLAGQR